MNKRVYIEESGCNRRKLDVGKFRDFFLANGYQLVSGPKSADYIIVTTCAFKRSEEDASILRVRHYVNHYQAKVVVYGCLPDIAPNKYKEFEHIPSISPKEVEKIDRLFDNIQISFADVSEKNIIESETNLINSLKRKVSTGEAFTREFVQQAQSTAQQRWNGFMTPQQPPFYLFVCRGCLGKCSYCAIRRSVGYVRSKTTTQVLGEFYTGLSEGYELFSLLGDDPGCYGLDIDSTFPALLKALIEQKNQYVGNEGQQVRFEIKEIHPKFLVHYGDEFVDILSDKSFERLLCPVQSGSDRVLQVMQREHLSEPLRETLAAIRDRNPGMVLDTQIMVGFPTEEEEEFEQTLEYVAESGFDSVVVFPYDDKEGTGSSRLYPKVPSEIIKKRVRRAFRFFKEENIQAYYNCP